MAKNMTELALCKTGICMIVLLLAPLAVIAQPEDERATTLEEVIVTSQKREETLQEAPLSIAAFGEQQLEIKGITNLGDLGGGAIPSLRIQPFVNSPSTLTIAIRGNGPSDPGQITRESSVAVYMDDVYMSRAQGLAMEVADLERIEVLRGPQGTLFGRNATGGAVRMISKKPTGEFGFRQLLGGGNYDQVKSATHLDLPEMSGVRTKLDYLHSQKDGWVDNTAPQENDFGDSEQDALRFAADWDLNEQLNLNYAYDWSDIETTNLYYQVLFDGIGLLQVEDHATNESRFPVRPLDPTKTKQQGHALTLTWQVSDTLMLKSISAYRDLEEETRNNYAGVLLSNGLITATDVEQDQFSQEFQLLGDMERLQWIVGLYYYEENAKENLLNLASLDLFGEITGTPLTPIFPPIPSPTDAPRNVKTQTESTALFGQVTWTPPVLADSLEVTLGLRYTEDDKQGRRNYPLPGLVAAGQQIQRFNLGTDSLDPSVTFSYTWTEQLNAYLRWANAYKAAGVNLRSFTFLPYAEESVETWEVGLKSEFLDSRARLNLAIFKTEYEDFQIDFSDPVTPTFSETINAAKTVGVDGIEIEATLVPTAGLTLDLNLTHLSANPPDQPNPLNGGISEPFNLAQTPEYSVAGGIDYKFEPLSFGVLSLHVDVISSSKFAFAPKNFDYQDSYTLINGRVTLADIAAVSKGNLRLALWGKNLKDEKYRVFAFPVGNPPLVIPAAYGEPRTYGIELEYRY